MVRGDFEKLKGINYVKSCKYYRIWSESKYLDTPLYLLQWDVKYVPKNWIKIKQWNNDNNSDMLIVQYYHKFVKNITGNHKLILVRMFSANTTKPLTYTLGYDLWHLLDCFEY